MKCDKCGRNSLKLLKSEIVNDKFQVEVSAILFCRMCGNRQNEKKIIK